MKKLGQYTWHFAILVALVWITWAAGVYCLTEYYRWWHVVLMIAAGVGVVDRVGKIDDLIR